jgi:Zn finger protein HypA/HybF involved in hydrogenase expression
VCNGNNRRNKNRIRPFPEYENKLTNNPDISYRSKANQPGYFCFKCGFNNKHKLTDVNQFCDYCGSEFFVCPISKAKFSLGDQFGQCLNCDSLFHLHHLESWFEANQYCPMCKSVLHEIRTGEVGFNFVKVY